MRIEITSEGVTIRHGLNDEGKLYLHFNTNDHITVEVDGNLDLANVTFRTGKYVNEPAHHSSKRTNFVRQRADLVVRECEHDWPNEWDYTYSPAGEKSCRKCDKKVFD